MSANLEYEGVEKSRESGVAKKEGRTAVRIAGEGEEQTLLEDREVTLDYLFGPEIRQEHLHRTCRTSQTSARPSRFSLTLFPYLDASSHPGYRPELP